MTVKAVDGVLYAAMLRGGAVNLARHEAEINDLNVFPIPDGDTGSNMLLTVRGGLTDTPSEVLSETAEQVSRAMLLSARGNSGVILSQFFAGLSMGLVGLTEADADALGAGFLAGVRKAYGAVMTPTEGTVLTVLREATDKAVAVRPATTEAFFDAFLAEARASLGRTPDLLPVLKKAGVVDSGGAGMIRILEGMAAVLRGEEISDTAVEVSSPEQEPSYDAFTEDSVLEYGYCTELLLRLQRAKTDVESFDVTALTEELRSLGDSIVAVKSGSAVKLHIHTATPDRVLAVCQRYGEFLKVKIENMSLQHNGLQEKRPAAVSERKRYAVVAVASGEGLKQTLRDLGADVVIDGGQCMNPPAEAFLRAFDEVNAETVFVLPNNGNVILTAKQAASLYKGSDVRVIPSRTVGEGYAALTMYDPTSSDADTVEAGLAEAMNGVVTAEISRCVRDACMDGYDLHEGDYVGIRGKELLACSRDRAEAVAATAEALRLGRYDVCILVRGKDTPAEEALALESRLRGTYRGQEIYLLDGGQAIFDYIIILE